MWKSFFTLALWIGLPLIAGIISRFLFGTSFWIGVGITLFSLVVNALIIEWEDRQKDGWGS